MDSQQFDRITTAFAQSRSRRGVMTLLGATAAGALSVGILAAPDRVSARRKKGKGNTRCLKSGASCETDKQCCTAKGLICEVPQNASNSDTECCGAQGAVCGGVDDNGDFQPPYCCIGEAGVRSFVCSADDPGQPGVRGTCIPAPPDED